MEKSVLPDDLELEAKLGVSFALWQSLKKYVYDHVPHPAEEWNYPGKNYGWSFRMKSKKRNIIYFLPGDGSFRVAFVFGQKAFDQVMKSDVSDTIKTELSAARVYAEGRGVRIPVNNESILSDIYTLLDIKLLS